MSASSQTNDLKNRILFTIFILAVYRFGTFVPIPGIDPEQLQTMMSGNQKGLLGMFNVFSGGAVSRMAIFALGIMPYISSSIIVQLLTGVSEYFKNLKNLGHKILYIDEEGLMSFNKEFTHRRVTKKSLELIDTYFTWGSKHQSDMIDLFPDFRNKFKVVGNPRFDIIKKNSKSFYVDEVKKIKDASDEKKAKLEKLNLLMQELLVKKVLIPISLKGLTKNSKQAKIEEANLGKKKQIKFKLKTNGLNCDLDMEKPPLFDTGEFSLRFFAGEAEYALQVRSFRYSKPTTGPQTDITPKSGGAKLGKSSVEATRPFLKKLGLDLPPSVVKDPMITISGKFTSQQIDFWTNFYDKIKDVKIEGQKVNWDAPLVYGDRKSSFKNNLITGLSNFERDRNTLGRIFSKLHALRMIALY